MKTLCYKILPTIGLFTTFLLIFTGSLSAQSKEDKSVDYYLDDGGISERKNVIKLNLASSLIGDISLHYERVITDAISLEIGVGKIIGSYNEISLYSLIEDNSLMVEGPGYSFWIYPKLYMLMQAPEHYNVGLLYRERVFDNGLRNKELAFMYSYQFLFGEGFMIGGAFGAGFKWNNLNMEGDSFQVSVPMMITIGYKF